VRSRLREDEEEDEALTTPVLPWFAALLTLLALAAALRGWARPELSGWLLLSPMVVYCLAELWAPSLAGFGRFPLSVAALVVLIAVPGYGKLSWIFAVLLGASLRFVRSRLRGEPILTVLADSLPELWAGLACVALLGVAPTWTIAVVGAVIYLASWQILPGLFSKALAPRALAQWSIARERSLAALTFLAIVGVALAWVIPGQPGPALLVLVSIPLLAIPMQAQLKVMQAEVTARQQALRERLQQRTTKQLADLKTQVELQRVEVELQHRVLTLVGELFMETSHIQNPGDMRQTLVGFVRRVIPCSRISMFESEDGKLKLTASSGPEALQPDESLFPKLSSNRVEAVEHIDKEVSYLAAQIPNRGLLVVSDAAARWQSEHAHLLLRLAHHLPMVLDAVRYREMQTRALEDEQTRRRELDRLAARLTATLDLLGQLVSARSVQDLVQTAQEKLPNLLPGYQAEVEWHDQLYRSSSVQQKASYAFPLYGGRSQEGRLRLFSDEGKPLSVLDTELLRLFSSQFACLLEGAELNAQLRHALDQLKQSQAQLVQSSKMAAIGQLAAGVAHELNTPLGAISIAIELAVDTVQNHPDRAARRLGKALESVEQMQTIISKLLFYSRDSRGIRAQVELNKVIQDSYELVAHTLKLNGVEVEVNPGPEVVIDANANELQQVFSNLLINAKDACGLPGAQRKKIEMWLEQKNGRAVVHVRDYGAGMDEATRSRIFEPFFTTKPIGEGTGLGLSTSMELIEQHGGELGCQSQPGQGTHFTVALPLEQAG